MTDRQMFTCLDASLLAEAFPQALRSEALEAGEAIVAQLHEGQFTGRYETKRFSVRVGGETVLIPERLYFAVIGSNQLSADAWLMARCLRTRSNNGFERQRAARDVLADTPPWAAPFIVALIGEYVIEMLLDIEAAMSPALLDVMASFVAANPDYWQLTKQRVPSYWDAYYRRSLKRSDYSGFKLVEQVEAAVGALDVSTGSPAS